MSPDQRERVFVAHGRAGDRARAIGLAGTRRVNDRADSLFPALRYEFYFVPVDDIDHPDAEMGQ
jgi:hypothetical protein